MESVADSTSEPLPPIEEAAPPAAVEEPVQGSVRPPATRQASSAAVVGSEVVVADVERALVELLRCYKGALKFAADMPVFGRCRVSGAKMSGDRALAAKALGENVPRVRFPWRWGARFYTRVYVETHVRKHLQAIRSRLRLELLGTTAPEDRDQVIALEADLAEQVGPLLGWRRIFGVITRLPPVAAALPLLFAAAAHRVSGGISWQTFSDTVIVLVATTVVVWVLVVWPSIRLGFRIKRAIFCGGLDLLHPLLNDPGELQWEWFTSAKVYDNPNSLWGELFREMTGRKQRQNIRQDFPEEDVYQAEDALYDALGRRKPGEVPIDMLLGFTPYLWFAFAVLDVIGLVQIVASGFDLPALYDIFPLLVMVLIPLVFPRLVVQAVRNYRLRSH